MIDFHLHVHHKGRTLEQAIAHLDAHGIDMAVNLPLEDEHHVPPFPTEEAFADCAKYPDRLIPFCSVDPRKPDRLKRIEEYAQRGCKGFGEHKTKLPADDPRSIEIYEFCGKLGLPVVIHFQRDTYSYNFPSFGTVLERCPETTFIGHAQDWWANISTEIPTDTHYPDGKVVPGGLTDRWLSDCDSLYGDLSAGSGFNSMNRDHEFATSFLERHRKKLLWASDCPCTDGRGGDIANECIAARSIPLLWSLVSEGTFADITHNNAARLLGLADET